MYISSREYWTKDKVVYSWNIHNLLFGDEIYLSQWNTSWNADISRRNLIKRRRKSPSPKKEDVSHSISISWMRKINSITTINRRKKIKHSSSLPFNAFFPFIFAFPSSSFRSFFFHSLLFFLAFPFLFPSSLMSPPNPSPLGEGFITLYTPDFDG